MNDLFKQIKLFVKLCSIEDEVTYTSIMRELNKKSPKLLREFRIVYKRAFDKALIDNNESPENYALAESIIFLHSLESRASVNFLYKTADQLGDPAAVGVYLSDLIKFILRRINNPLSRQKSIYNLKGKILALDPVSISNKKMPAGASIGQSLVILKHLLFGKHPDYIRKVLDSLIKNL